METIEAAVRLGAGEQGEEVSPSESRASSGALLDGSGFWLLEATRLKELRGYACDGGAQAACKALGKPPPRR